MKKYLLENKVNYLLLLIMCGISISFFDSLPDQIPTKFDFSGNPIQYSSKYFVTIFSPVMYLFVMIFTGQMVKISPEKYAMKNSQNAMSTIMLAVGFLFLGIHGGLIVDPAGKIEFTRYFSLGTALFMIIAGNIFGKTERNFFMGVRIPWTINSATNWRATHRFMGKLFVVFGLILLVTSFIIPRMDMVVAGLIIPSFAPILYSYFYYKKNELKA